MQIYVAAVDGATPPRLLLDLETLDLTITDWSDDGRLLFFDHLARRTDTAMISVYDLETEEMRTLLQDEFSQAEADLSPDGRWLAYNSEETGRSEVYIRPYPALNRKWQVSVNGGSHPKWNADGSALSFFGPPSGLFAAEIHVENAEVSVSTPRLLRAFRNQFAAADVTLDFSHLLVARRVDEEHLQAFCFVSNWDDGLLDGSR